MIRNLIIIFSLVLLNNCATSGSALLGPIFTGAKTGSIYQASVSYSTGKIMNEFVVSEIFNQKDEQKDPIIITSYKVDDISLSEVFEEEPLP